MSDPGSTITLRAHRGTPLADEKLRNVVLATARAIAERNDVTLIALAATHDTITATLDQSRLAALGFAAELRRVTDNWHRQRTGESLWGEPDVPGMPDLPDFPL